MPDYNNNSILDTIARDTQAGFRMLVHEYKEPVYWHIRRITVLHHDAEDALQETFLRIFRNIGNFNRDLSLDAWIFRIATNEALRLKQRNKNSTIPIDAPDNGATVDRLIADEYCDYSDAEAILFQRAILSLPPKQQLAFNLRYYNDMDYDTIADIINSNATTVKANYHAAKEKIIRYINSHF
ncbi:MAG: RNA polymerase sigma factor [Bacteroidales bacterium]|nr:RNA polymerase sigma factor [Bacteroidales bacterium]